MNKIIRQAIYGISLMFALHHFSSAAIAEEAASPIASNVAVVSDYSLRGITQTHGKQALQGGIDYSHPIGFYLGLWGSNITWVENYLGKGKLEVDVYGGFRGIFLKSFSYDVGYITYNYPDAGSPSPTNLADPNTQEIFGGIGYQWLSTKYSYTTSSHFFGWYGGPNYDQKTMGSNYIELNATYDFGSGWTLIGHVGHQKVKNLNAANYSDWKVGASKDTKWGVVALTYSATNTSGTCNSGNGGTNPYCWGTGGSTTHAPTANYRDVSKGTAVLSLTKTF